MPTDDKIFDISFVLDGQQYKGWVNPSDKINDKGMPVSFHVVLNEVSFGNLSHSGGKWVVDEDRPAGLAAAAGREISRRYATGM